VAQAVLVQLEKECEREGGDKGDGLRRHFLVLLACKRSEYCMGIGSEDRRNSVLLSGEHCLKGPLHRFSSIEKDAHVSFRLCYFEQAKKDAERLLRGP
jgi:hypothetical protein